MGNSQALRRFLIPALFLLSGSLLASSPDPASSPGGPLGGAGRHEVGAPEGTPVKFLVSHPLPFPPASPGNPQGPATQFFQSLTRNLEEESRREPLLNTQAFLSERWASADRHMEEFRSRRAEVLMDRAFDEYLDDQLDRVLQEVRVLRTLSFLLDRAAEMDFRWSGTGSRSNREEKKRELGTRSRPEGKIQIRLDFHPKVRLEGKWAGFTGNLDLPLLGDQFRFRLQREILPGITAHLDSTYPTRIGAHFTTLALSVVF